MRFIFHVAAAAASLFLITAQAADTAANLISRGDAQWAAGKLDEAQATFEQAVKAEPRKVGAYMKLGGLQLARNDFAGCIDTYQRAIGLSPNNAKAWIGLGMAYLHTGSQTLSRAAFEEALRIEPSRKEQLEPIIAKLSVPRPHNP